MSGIPVWKLIPERYRDPEEQGPPPTEADTRRGFAVMCRAWLGTPPIEDPDKESKE